jgi:hypothetical protein
MLENEYRTRFIGFLCEMAEKYLAQEQESGEREKAEKAS